MRKLEARDPEAMNKWAKVLKARMETGEPYIMFKDNVNKNNIPKVTEVSTLMLGQNGIHTQSISYSDADNDSVCFDMISGPGAFVGCDYIIDTDTLAGDFLVKYTYTDGQYVDSSQFVLKVLTDDMATPRIDVDKTYIKNGEDLLVRIFDPFDRDWETYCPSV